MNIAPFRLKCPQGHRWYKCRHEELRHPVLGQALMAVGTVHIFIGLWGIIHG